MKSLTGVELKRFLRDYRRLNQPRRDIVALLHSVEYPYNVGAIFRLADGAGLSRLILSGITPIPPNPTIQKVGRSKDRNVPWVYEKNPEEAIAALRAEGFRIVAVELTAEAISYSHYDYPDKVCLVVGNEDHGVTKAVLALCDTSVFIPMYGKGRSLNVSAALGIVAYHIRQSE
jgi:23S rRNA (guanosine2251-2'-O)-methyltransferase